MDNADTTVPSKQENSKSFWGSLKERPLTLVLIVLGIGAIVTGAVVLAQYYLGRKPSEYPEGGFWVKAQFHYHDNWGLPDVIPTTDPAIPVEYYHNRDYNVISPTDLNYYQPVDGLKNVWDKPGRFLIIGGEELNYEPVGDDYKIVDSLVIGINESLTVPGSADMSVSDIMKAQANVGREAGGIPVIAHPNLSWSITLEDILETDPKKSLHMEVRNGEPGMNDFGGENHPSTFELWDGVLSTGRQMYGWATDDAHHFDPEEWNPREVAVPDSAWMYVYVEELTEEAVLEALDAGRFYGSVGVEFLGLDMKSDGISIELDPKTSDIGWSGFYPGNTNATRYKTVFFGEDGKKLATDESYNPSYTCKADDLYVRAVVTNSDGFWAFTQAVFC